MKHVVGGDGEIDAVDLLRHDRLAARGDQDLARRHRPAGLLERQRVLIDELGSILDHLCACIAHIARIDA
ncbi:hypothetical protein D3C83_189290 [compost metagenome]